MLIVQLKLSLEFSYELTGKKILVRPVLHGRMIRRIVQYFAQHRSLTSGLE